MLELLTSLGARFLNPCKGIWAGDSKVPAFSLYSLIIRPVAIPVNTYLVVIPKEWGFALSVPERAFRLALQCNPLRGIVRRGFPAMLCLRYYSYSILAYPRTAVNEFVTSINSFVTLFLSKVK